MKGIALLCQNKEFCKWEEFKYLSQTYFLNERNPNEACLRSPWICNSLIQMHLSVVINSKIVVVKKKLSSISI
jgi:hypothetical protein